jgi:pimeloyl-ACP methyl ester carboxylesterase
MRKIGLALVGMMVFSGVALAQDFDPVTDDLPSIDEAAPPQILELKIPSHGEQLSALMYTANGPGPHPTAVLVHGFPGNEKNLDTAQALRRAGFNVLFYHPRGAWGSGGDYSIPNFLADAKEVVAYLRRGADGGTDRIDVSKISLVGHSLGGFTVVYTGARDKDITCTVAIAPADLGLTASQINYDEIDLTAPEMNVPENSLWMTDADGTRRGYGRADLLRDIKPNADDYANHKHMDGFKDRPLLVITGARDTAVPFTSVEPVIKAANASGVKPFDHISLDTDHSFSWMRTRLNREIVGWMGQHCR